MNKTPNERLREILLEYDLTRADVSRLLHLTITSDGQTPAVNKWLANPTDKSNYRKMHAAYLELLEYRLGIRVPEIFNPA